MLNKDRTEPKYFCEIVIVAVFNVKWQMAIYLKIDINSEMIVTITSKALSYLRKFDPPPLQN